MFKHLSLHEKIELLLGTRTSGGALPLPEAFGAALSYLHDKGGTPDDVLRKVIREKRQVEFREARILEVCGDWESFCTVILDVLENAGFIARREDSWSLTEKAIPGRELTILRVLGENKEDRRVRVTFFGEQHRLERNQVEVLKGDAEALISRLPGLSYLSASAKETVNQYLLACSQVLRETLANPRGGKGDTLPEITVPLPSVKRRGDVAAWYRKWVLTAGWHTQIEAWQAWNDEHPGDQYHDASMCPSRNAAQILLRAGLMEKRPVSNKRDTSYNEYRYTGGSYS